MQPFRSDVIVCRSSTSSVPRIKSEPETVWNPLKTVAHTHTHVHITECSIFNFKLLSDSLPRSYLYTPHQSALCHYWSTQAPTPRCSNTSTFQTGQAVLTGSRLALNTACLASDTRSHLIHTNFKSICVCPSVCVFVFFFLFFLHWLTDVAPAGEEPVGHLLHWLLPSSSW